MAFLGYDTIDDLSRFTLKRSRTARVPSYRVAHGPHEVGFNLHSYDWSCLGRVVDAQEPSLIGSYLFRTGIGDPVTILVHEKDLVTPPTQPCPYRPE